MRIRTWFLAGLLALTLTASASAQQLSTSFGSTMTGTSTTTGNTSGFMSSVMAKPNYTAMQTKPTVPTPLNFNIGRFLPTFPNLQNTMLMRNVFGSSPQASVQMPTTKQAPPPPKKTGFFN